MYNKKVFLDTAGVKNEQEFYKKYPNPDVFFTKHPEMGKGGEIPKNYMQDGGQMPPQPMQQQEAVPIQGQAPQEQGMEQQIMQVIEMYAQMSGVAPEEIMKQLEQMNPEQQEQAIQQMMQEVQGAQQGEAQPTAMPVEQEQAQMMQYGGSMYKQGQELELSPSEVSRLRNMGYKMDIIN